jgi:CubicO group peptidase (beta-lactamase class C family)
LSARNFEVPADGRVGTVCAIAHAYSVFATGGKELGLRKETLRQLMAPPVAPVHGFHDEVLKVETRFALGFAKPLAKDPFGHPGSGGSFGFADSEARIGYAYVPNRMDRYLIDPRGEALRRAMYRSIGEPDPYPYHEGVRQ